MKNNLVQRSRFNQCINKCWIFNENIHFCYSGWTSIIKKILHFDRKFFPSRLYAMFYHCLLFRNQINFSLLSQLLRKWTLVLISSIEKKWETHFNEIDVHSLSNPYGFYVRMWMGVWRKAWKTWNAPKACYITIRASVLSQLD